jgi:hypothetical protein
MAQNTSNVEKTPPQPQQQPNKTQKTTQHKKQTQHRHPKKLDLQKNPQQQPKKKRQNQIDTYSLFHFLQTQVLFFN